jgi:hypothetical protein
LKSILKRKLTPAATTQSYIDAIIAMPKYSERKEITLYTKLKEEKNDYDAMNRMWEQRLKLEGTNEWKTKNTTEQMSYFTRSFSDLIGKYMIQARYLIVNNEYSPNAFAQYQRDLHTRPYKSRDDWIKLQADYIVYLFRELNRRTTNDEAKRVHEISIKSLTAEFKSFEEDFEKAKKILAEREAAEKKEKKDRLLLLAQGNEKIAKMIRDVINESKT